MEVNRLTSDELSYELQIRGCQTEGSVQQKRSLLRYALREEREGRATVPTSTTLTASDELSICGSKLTNLEEEVKAFDFDNRKNEFERLYSRLRHVILRLDRICPENDDQCFQLTQLTQNALKLKDELNLTYDNVPLTGNQIPEVAFKANQSQAQMSILDTVNPLIPEVVHSRLNISQPTDDQARDRNLVLPELGAEMSRIETQPSTSLEREQRSQASTSAAIQSSPLQRNISQHNFSHRLTQQPNTDRRSACSVRFADEAQRSYFSENWSRVPNPTQTRDSDRTFLRDEHGNFANRLAALNFSTAGNDDVPSFFYNKYLDIGRWNLKYDGVSSVNDFLDRVEELRRSRGVSKAQLLRSAAELFTKDALLWFRTNEFLSWDDLVVKLRDSFQPYDYENGIWEELRRRTQGAQERVVIFIASMEQLFDRLSRKPLEETRVRIIRRNLLPYIQSQLSLHVINSVQVLIQLCRVIEETEIRVQRFCPPPTNYRQLIEPGLAYHRPTSSTFSPSVSTISSEDLNVSQHSEVTQPVRVNVLSSNQQTCWNCRGTGHRFRQCDKPRRLFCFKCGHDGVTTNRCPKCSKNENTGRQ